MFNRFVSITKNHSALSKTVIGRQANVVEIPEVLVIKPFVSEKRKY